MSEKSLEKIETGVETKKKVRWMPTVRAAKKKAFLRAVMISGGNLSSAARAAGISTSTHYDWCDKDPTYAAAFSVALDKSTQALLDEAVRRATEGDKDPIVHKGEIIGYRDKRSDNLLMFLLKQRDPTFRDNHQTNLGFFNSGENVAIQFNIPRPDTDQS